MSFKCLACSSSPSESPRKRRAGARENAARWVTCPAAEMSTRVPRAACCALAALRAAAGRVRWDDIDCSDSRSLSKWDAFQPGRIETITDLGGHYRGRHLQDGGRWDVLQLIYFWEHEDRSIIVAERIYLYRSHFFLHFFGGQPRDYPEFTRISLEPPQLLLACAIDLRPTGLRPMFSLLPMGRAVLDRSQGRIADQHAVRHLLDWPVL